jgi:hypothetical protein
VAHRVGEALAARGGDDRFAAAAHFFEQYFTCSQSRSHFFRQAMGRWHCTHGLVGR